MSSHLLRAVALALTVGAATPLARAEAPAPAFALPADAAQVVLVLTDGWDAKTGTMWRFERGAQGLTRAGDGVPVTVGRAGLAWGRGLHPEQAGDGPVKKEGDGRAVAGVFRLGTAAGYAAKAPEGVTLPYRPSTPLSRCVDDPASSHYNTLVEQGATPDWKSAEKMRRADGLYEWLVVVEHNTAPAPAPGGGSCIFLHVWRAPGKPTVGCTTMAGDTLVGLLRWLRPEAAPVLVQMPKPAHAALREAWGLPSP
jgi:L,D-peptidoglycan transpeptidase YkuD (ErfK/YbiS/YcfS/YnhG family)